MVSEVSQALASFTGLGVTSRKQIEVRLYSAGAGSGIKFRIPAKEGGQIELPATAASVVNTLRNVTIGDRTSRLCIVEHILCAVALWGLEDLLIEVDGPELPLGDGSSAFWLELLAKSGLSRKPINADLELKETITVSKGDRALIAIPDQSFSLTYLMDWNHPAIGRKWRAWTPADKPEEIAIARTFGSLKEHQMLGLTNDVVSLTDHGFTQELRFEDEPVRHKLLDLLGDLVLAGVNPMRWKARFIGIKSGHEMDVEMAKRLAATL